MRHNAFLRSLAFAAAAATGLFVGSALLAPILGTRGALRLLVVGSVVLHLALMAPSRARALVAGCAAGGLGAALLLLPLGVAATSLAAAALLGACRSALLFRARPARALLLELVLLGSGVALAGFLADRSGGSLALAFWGFWLVQSGFFLVGGIAPRADDDAQEDPFERARTRILALLD